MPRKSFWASLLVAMLLVCAATLYSTTTASASPAHTLQTATQQHATNRNMPLTNAACPPGQYTVYYLSNNYNYPSVFNNYTRKCLTQDPCVTGETTIYSWVCLYQDSNYGGQEITFTGYGCANLTDFAGPGSGGTWNDTMSSFRTIPASTSNPYGGAFWWDTYDNGYYYLFGYPGSGRVTSTSYIGNTWNDQASSLQLDPNPGGC